MIMHHYALNQHNKYGTIKSGTIDQSFQCKGRDKY